MNGCDFNMAISAVACGIAKGKSDEELALLACFFTQLGDSIATIQAGNICFCGNESGEEEEFVLP